MKFLTILAASATLFSSAQASAATLAYTLTGSFTANWTMDSNPQPSFVHPNSLLFSVSSITGTFLGIPSTDAVLTFRTTAAATGGGLQLNSGSSNLGFISFGPQLYSGNEANPTMLTGTFVLQSATLTVVEVAAAAVPEPASWAMLITGFALTGTMLRRRQSKVRITYG
jgi:hypothetical protein